jgi:hypothetical protein
MMPQMGPPVDNQNPTACPPSSWTPARGPLSSSSAIFEMTKPGACNAGPRVIAHYGGAEAGPTARHLNHPRDITSEQLPCVQV